MKCPQCNIELNCGCSSCMIHSPDKPNKMIKTGDDTEKCPGCGLDMSLDEWFDEEGKQYDERKSTKL